METQSWQRVCNQTAEEHSLILQAVHRLESATYLLGVDITSERRKIAGRELKLLIDSFEKHSTDSELPGGLIGQIESVKGRSEQVSAVINVHRGVIESARALLQNLRDERSLDPFSIQKRQLALLTATVREHEAREIDLIYETNTRIMGGQG